MKHLFGFDRRVEGTEESRLETFVANRRPRLQFRAFSLRYVYAIQA